MKLLKGKYYSFIINRKGRLYLVFEFMDRNLLEVLEDQPNGLDVQLLVLNYIDKRCKALYILIVESYILLSFLKCNA